MSKGEERLTYLKEAISLFEEIGHINGIATAKTALGVYYVEEQKRPDLALAPYTEALETFEQIGETYGATSTKTSLVVLDQDLGEADRWMDSVSLSIEAIFDEAQAKLQTDADAQYQTSKKEAELAQQELELERERSARSIQLIVANSKPS